MFKYSFELLYRIVFGYCNLRVCNRYVVIKGNTQAHRTNRIKKQQTIEFRFNSRCCCLIF